MNPTEFFVLLVTNGSDYESTQRVVPLPGVQTTTLGQNSVCVCFCSQLDLVGDKINRTNIVRIKETETLRNALNKVSILPEGALYTDTLRSI